MVDDYATPEEKRAKRRAEKAAKAAEAIEISVVRDLLKNPNGRRWIWDFLGFCSIYHTVVSQDPHFTYLNEGKRQVGLKLLAVIVRADPAGYVRMMTEQADAAGREPVLNRADPDDERNYDGAGRWVGEGPEPDFDEPVGYPAWYDAE